MAERTDLEIVNRIRELAATDFFGFESTDLLTCLPYDKAKEFLKPETTEEKWKEVFTPRDRESVLKRMEEYMSFAWEKANNCRGLSAARSMNHYSAWVWLLGDDLGNLNDYEYYGKDNLVKICQKYGWDHHQWDDGIRTNTSD